MPSFIDYVSLLLVNMVAGYSLLAGYVYKGLDDADQTRWAPGFLLVGMLALTFGGHLCMTWPLPGPYNSAFGEMSVLFGGIFFMAGVSLAKGWDLLIVAYYAFFAGLAAMVLGAKILEGGLTKVPWLAAIGFVLSGAGGVFAAPLLLWFRDDRRVRLLGALVLGGAALVWAATVYPEYWEHMAMFKNWMPLIARGAPGK